MRTDPRLPGNDPIAQAVAAASALLVASVAALVYFAVFLKDDVRHAHFRRHEATELVVPIIAGAVFGYAAGYSIMRRLGTGPRR